MSSKSKSANAGGEPAAENAAGEAKATESGATAGAESPADWARQVVEKLVEAQKKWIDLTSQQNALVLQAITEGMTLYRSAPTPALAEWAKQGVEGFVEAQKRWAEVAQQQSAQFYE